MSSSSSRASPSPRHIDDTRAIPHRGALMMLAGTIWQRELVEFAQRRRALIIKRVFPLLVAVPLVLSGAPTIYAAMALTMLAAIVGALGTGAVTARARPMPLKVRDRTP